jgi:hypothetical protein
VLSNKYNTNQPVFTRNGTSMRLLKLTAAGLAITLSAISTARAAPIDFNLTAPDSRSGILNSTYAKEYKYERDALGLSVTGWSYGTKTTTTEVCTKANKHGKCTKTQLVTTTSLNEAIEQEYVGKWEGLGIERTDSPNHAVDNEGGDYDMHLLSFDELVKLTSLDLGWYQKDTDISILAFTGSSFENSSLLGKKWQDLVGNGWDLVGNYYNVDYGNSGAVNEGGIISQYWLVGAYNPGFGTAFSGPNIDKTKGVDYYKLKGVTVERPPVVKVAEPGSVLLMVLGLLGLGFIRRRNA